MFDLPGPYSSIGHILIRIVRIDSLILIRCHRNVHLFIKHNHVITITNVIKKCVVPFLQSDQAIGIKQIN